ncbi:9661_t:CDS:2, partial [Funneliformis mosseae]
DRDFASQPNSLVLKPEKSKEMPAPMQGDWSYRRKSEIYSGLSPDNEKRVEEFGFKKPLKEMVKYLVRDPTLSTEIQKYKEDLRKKLFCGLSPTNQDEVKSWGMYLPLDELIERLRTLE